ncbi:MAG: TIGR00366 family protein [Bryobacterales bacterium]|nr:TIGR00366 family protein [Bryobacterales bacterium]
MKTQEQPAKGPPEAFAEDRLYRIARTIGDFIPDAMTMAILLMVLLACAALLMGNTVLEVMDAYYVGLWMLLPFTMQMTLILVLGSALASTRFFGRMIHVLSRLPRSEGQTIALSMATTCCLAYCFWGLSLALAPLVAVSYARQSERKGFPVDFPFLLSCNAAAGAIWQFGFSASAPLLMNTPGHFLEEETGLMPLSTTIWAPATIVFLGIYLTSVFILARLLMPKTARPISLFPESRKLADATLDAAAKPPAVPMRSDRFAERLEASKWPCAVLTASLIGWLAYHFGVKGGGLQLNSLITILLTLGLLLHGSVLSFTRALPRAVVTAWPVIVLYHLYAGVAGLLQHTSIGSDFAEYFASISTEHTFPLLTLLAAAVVSVFVPSSGGQWVIQGFITTKASVAVGVTAQRGLLALSVGDHVGNLVSPFWAVIAAGIARMDFRTYIGYNYVWVLFWVGLGALCFTFLAA